TITKIPANHIFPPERLVTKEVNLNPNPVYELTPTMIPAEEVAIATKTVPFAPTTKELNTDFIPIRVSLLKKLTIKDNAIPSKAAIEAVYPSIKATTIPIGGVNI